MLSGSPIQGALLVLGFGLGTLPMLLAMGRASEFLHRLVRKPAIRRKRRHRARRLHRCCGR